MEEAVEAEVVAEVAEAEHLQLSLQIAKKTGVVQNGTAVLMEFKQEPALM